MQKRSGKSFIFSVRHVLNIINRRKWILILPLLIIPPIAWFGADYIEPQFRSEVILSLGGRFQVNNALENLLGYDPNLIGRLSDRRDEINGLYRQITSSPYLQQLGRLLNLENNPEVLEQAALLKSYRRRISNEDAIINVMVGYLREKISIRWAGQDQVGIRAFDSDPERARDIAKYLSEIFIREQVRSKVGAVRLTEDFSWELLEKYETALDEKAAEKTSLDAEFALIQIDSVISSPENRRAIILDIENTSARINALENQKSRLQEKLENNPDSGPIPALPAEVASSIRDIRQTYSAYLDLVLDNPWGSYEIFRVKNRAAEQFNKAAGEIDQYVDDTYRKSGTGIKDILKEYLNTVADLEQTKAELSYLRRAEARIGDRLSLIPEYQAKADKLEREVNAARDLRDNFRRQQESSLITQAILRQSEYKIIQEAEIPLYPLKPNKSEMMTDAIFIALLLGIMIATFTEIYSTSFRKADEIERELGLPILGIVPSIKDAKKVETIG